MMTMGSNRKQYTSAGAKKIAEQKQNNKITPKRNAKRVDVHGDGKPNHSRSR
jgi:hypothetical protein